MIEYEDGNDRDRFGSAYCEATFEEIIEKLPVLKESCRRLSIGKFDLEAKKLTAVNVVNFEDCRFELFLAKEPRSGYAMKDHDKICDDNGFLDDLGRVLHGLYFEVEDRKRCLIVANIQFLIGFDDFSFDNESLGILNTLKRYKIDMVFSKSHGDLFSLDWVAEKIYLVDDFENSVDKFIFDEWTRNLAIELGWTNNELIRFRYTCEVPPKKI